MWISTDPLEEDYPNLSAYCLVANNPIFYIDYDGKSIKGVIVAVKYVRRAYKIFKKTGRLAIKELKQAGLDEISDIAGDLYTIFDGKSPFVDKIKAGVDLVVGIDFNNNAEKGRKLLNSSNSKIKPNDGNAKPHGGKKTQRKN